MTRSFAVWLYVPGNQKESFRDSRVQRLSILFSMCSVLLRMDAALSLLRTCFGGNNRRTTLTEVRQSLQNRSIEATGS